MWRSQTLLVINRKEGVGVYCSLNSDKVTSDGMACLFLYCFYELKLWPHFSSLIFGSLVAFFCTFLDYKHPQIFFFYYYFLLQGRVHFLIYLFIFME